jgi:hypothetical protein
VLLEARGVDRLGDEAQALALGDLPEVGHHLQVLLDGHVQVQRRVLGEVADVGASADRVGDHVDPGHPGGALGGLEVAREDLHRGRLARPVGAEQADDLRRQRARPPHDRAHAWPIG